MDNLKAKQIVELIDEYSAILNSGSLVVCPVSGISFNVPELSKVIGVYFDSRHPIGVKSNYPAILKQQNKLYELNKMELAGIILTGLSLYGSVHSSLTTFKQNELLRANCTKKELVGFIDFLGFDFSAIKNKPTFRIEADFKALALISYQYTCFEIKNDLVGKTLTVAEAIEQRVILVNGKETVRSMTSDLKRVLKTEVGPYVSDESYSKMEQAVALALVQPTDEMVSRVIVAIHKKLGRETETFASEFVRYRAFFERAQLIKTELDLSFAAPAASTKEEQHAQASTTAQTSNSKTESLAERLAKLRALAAAAK